jgi:hypothetical protein
MAMFCPATSIATRCACKEDSAVEIPDQVDTLEPLVDEHGLAIKFFRRAGLRV